MLKTKDILDEKDKRLRMISKVCRCGFCIRLYK